MDKTDEILRRWITMYMESLAMSTASSKRVLYRILYALFGDEAKYTEDKPYEGLLEMQKEVRSSKRDE